MPEEVLDNNYQISWPLKPSKNLFRSIDNIDQGIKKVNIEKKNGIIKESQTLVKKIPHPEWLIQLSLSVYATAWALTKSIELWKYRWNQSLIVRGHLQILVYQTLGENVWKSVRLSADHTPCSSKKFSHCRDKWQRTDMNMTQRKCSFKIQLTKWYITIQWSWFNLANRFRLLKYGSICLKRRLSLSQNFWKQDWCENYYGALLGQFRE